MMEIPASAFRLRWHRTWPDVHNDFMASEDAGFCRIYHEEGGPQRGRWFWTCAKTTQLGSGYEETARQAAMAAESLFLPQTN